MAKWTVPTVALLVGLAAGSIVAYDKGTADGRAQEKSASVPLANRIADLQGQVQSLTQANQAYEAKFQRSTILYGGIVFQSRQWVIPADVEPIYVGHEAQADYTHFDPKTQTETIHLKPKQQ